MIYRIRKKLRSGKPSLGSWMQIPNSSVAEIMGRASYAWVAVDLEHGAFSRHILPDIFLALENGGALPIARVAQSLPKDVKQALDAGARGLILPMIESEKQLKTAIDSAFYPPNGTRGVGYCRANLFGKHFDEYSQQSNDILIVAQIEHIRAVENLERILSVDKLDAIIIGPYDLSGSMNLTAQFDHPEFVKVFEDILNTAKNSKVPAGLHIVQPDKETLKSRISQGFQFIAYGTDAVFLYSSSVRPTI
jgi:2-dehydro-3-deoxyglucarate aldolase